MIRSEIIYILGSVVAIFLSKAINFARDVDLLHFYYILTPGR